MVQASYYKTKSNNIGIVAKQNGIEEMVSSSLPTIAMSRILPPVMCHGFSYIFLWLPVSLKTAAQLLICEPRFV